MFSFSGRSSTYDSAEDELLMKAGLANRCEEVIKRRDKETPERAETDGCSVGYVDECLCFHVLLVPRGKKLLFQTCSETMKACVSARPVFILPAHNKRCASGRRKSAESHLSSHGQITRTSIKGPVQVFTHTLSAVHMMASVHLGNFLFGTRLHQYV